MMDTVTRIPTVPAAASPASGWRWPKRLAVHAVGIPVAIASFAACLTLFTVGVSTLVIWVGLPILVAGGAVARWFATIERGQSGLVWQRLDGDVYRPHRRAFASLLDPQVWRDQLHAILGFAVRFTADVFAVSWVAGSLGGLLWFTWGWALPDGNRGPFWLVTGLDWWVGEGIFQTVFGMVCCAAIPWVLAATTAVRFGFAKVLLSNPETALKARAERAELGRTQAVQAESHTLSMIERSIHDGPQQRLVRLTMDLEAARRRLAADDQQAASSYLDEALHHSREVIAELRAVARGIAPPQLAERGLADAVLAAAGRCPVDTVVDSDLPAETGWPEEVEAAAYFVVTESLTNVAKHSQATSATVLLTRDTFAGGEMVIVQVGDNGCGGAHVGKGHGLAGLAARVESLGGQLLVDSPAGGPTVVLAAIPTGRTDAGRSPDVRR